jgi:hypothetical protein
LAFQRFVKGERIWRESGVSVGTVETCDDPHMTLERLLLRGRLASLVVFAAMGCLFAWGIWWWTHASLLDERLGGAGFDMDPRPTKSATLHAMVAIADPLGDADETLTFRSARVHFAENTAGAVGRLSVCVPAEGAGVVGVVTGSLSEYCEEVRPLRSGTTMRWSGGSSPEYILLTVEPSRSGIARVDEIEVAYSRDRDHLWQRGNARAHVEITMRATK